MFIIFLLISLICITSIFYIKFSYTYFQSGIKIFYIISKILLLTLFFIYSIELMAYIKGGFKYTDRIDIEQYSIGEKVKIFTVNNRFWGIGEKFEDSIMATGNTPDSIQYRVSPIKSVLRNQVAVYYLPLSKHIIKMEYLTTNRHGVNIRFNFFENYCNYFENKTMIFIAFASFLVATIVCVRTLRK